MLIRGFEFQSIKFRLFLSCSNRTRLKMRHYFQYVSRLFLAYYKPKISTTKAGKTVQLTLNHPSPLAGAPPVNENY